MKDVITYSELMKELEKHRDRYSRSNELTKEQIKFIKACRVHEAPVSYSSMAKLWTRTGWGSMSASTIRNYCLKIIDN